MPIQAFLSDFCLGKKNRKIVSFLFLLGIGTAQAQDWSPAKDTIHGIVNAFCQYDGKLVAGGITLSIGPSSADNCILMWNNVRWISIGRISDSSVSKMKNAISAIRTVPVGKVVHYGHPSVRVNTFAVYEGELYVGGDFRNINGESFNCIAKWNGKKWSSISTGVDTSCEYGGTIHTLTVYNNELYAAGLFDRIGGVAAQNIAKWDGKKWSPMGKGLNSAVFAIESYKGKIYAGGMFDTADGKRVKHIAKWDGKSWDTVGRGCNYEVYKLITYKGNLYASGTFDWRKQYNNFYVWNDKLWNAVGERYHYRINTFTVSDENLYVASGRDYNGKFDGIRAFKLTGNEFIPIGDAINGVDVYAIIMYDGYLYLGGNFNAFMGSFPYKGCILRCKSLGK